ncbi:MAG TPA: hypothetical protein VKA27_02085, partial [Sunxiuqinia sp.]|nr:hypothetical protein [Sunxiuqinia sp.]
MKKRLLILTFCLSASFLYARRLNVNISSNWKFGSSFSASVTSQGFDDSGWETVDLPHTWNNLDGQDGDNNYKRGAFWYRKVFQVDANWEDKKVFLRFGSANMKTD